MLGDDDHDVQIAAIRAAGQRRAVGLVDPLAEHLGSGKASVYARRALLQLGDAALPAVSEIAPRIWRSFPM